MSQYYNARRTRNVFDPQNSQPFTLSRSKIDLFKHCQRCFYLDRRLGVARPPGYPFNLNSAVDTLLKKEFDIHRTKRTTHPLMKKYGVNAVPYQNPKMDEWRNPFKGVRYYHEPTNLIITGGVDDVWINEDQELIIVDYKATAKNGEVSIDAPWQISYKRQMEVYQWLFRRNEFEVSDIGYFVYANAKTDAKAFDAKLEFKVVLLPYSGNDDWIETALQEIKSTLNAEELPLAGSDCDYCPYREAAGVFEKNGLV